MIRYEPCNDCNNCDQFCSLADEVSIQTAINAYCENCIDHKVIVEEDSK